MPNGFLNLALGVAMQVGSPGPSETPNFPAPANAQGRYGFEGSSEQRYPFDSQQNWVHGYFQELPAYHGHHVFRPYNYKDVLSQSQTAAGWGERPMMPYSQQFWHKYHDQATMIKTSQYAPARAQQVWTQQPVTMPVGTQIVLPSSASMETGSLHMPQQQIMVPQQTIMMPPPLPNQIRSQGLHPMDGVTPAQYRQ